jgi:hypothetical protein
MDAVQQACANVRRENAAITAACYAAGDVRLACQFILDGTPLHAVKARLAELGTASAHKPANLPVSVTDDIDAAIKASGRPWR